MFSALFMTPVSIYHIAVYRLYFYRTTQIGVLVWSSQFIARIHMWVAKRVVVERVLCVWHVSTDTLYLLESLFSVNITLTVWIRFIRKLGRPQKYKFDVLWFITDYFGLNNEVSWAQYVGSQPFGVVGSIYALVFLKYFCSHNETLRITDCSLMS